ncbi:hypothetical protein Nmel_015250 [Mimus melanotis]
MLSVQPGKELDLPYSNAITGTLGSLPEISVQAGSFNPGCKPVLEHLLSDTWQLQLLHFCLFLGISLAALLANGLIISTVACGHHLHTPMFFFLLNLALSDLGCICTTVPKAMHNSLWDTSNISYSGCATLVFLFVFFIGAEFSLLTIMCYDCYMSICKPLHYGTLLGSRACAHMAAAAWVCGFLYSLLHTANTFSLPLCHGNALGQFFCEIPQILKLSCSHSYLRELGLLAVSVCLSFDCFVFIVFSYVQIFRAVLRIPSEQGRHKAFSTCLPHLVAAGTDHGHCWGSADASGQGLGAPGSLARLSAEHLARSMLSTENPREQPQAGRGQARGKQHGWCSARSLQGGYPGKEQQSRG